MKRIALALAGCLLIGCAGQPPASPRTPGTLLVHIPATATTPEHDEEHFPNAVSEYYPDKVHLMRLTWRQYNGGMIDKTCLDAGCTESEIKLVGLGAIDGIPMPDGIYLSIPSYDPQINLVRNADEQTIGYLVKNKQGATLMVPTLQQAEVWENK